MHEHFGWMKKCAYNKVPLQPPGTVTCGLYALYSGIVRLANEDLSLSQLTHAFFSDNLQKNEKHVRSFFSESEMKWQTPSTLD